MRPRPSRASGASLASSTSAALSIVSFSASSTSSSLPLPFLSVLFFSFLLFSIFFSCCWRAWWHRAPAGLSPSRWWTKEFTSISSLFFRGCCRTDRGSAAASAFGILSNLAALPCPPSPSPGDGGAPTCETRSCNGQGATACRSGACPARAARGRGGGRAGNGGDATPRGRDRRCVDVAPGQRRARLQTRRCECGVRPGLGRLTKIMWSTRARGGQKAHEKSDTHDLCQSGSTRARERSGE